MTSAVEMVPQTHSAPHWFLAPLADADGDSVAFETKPKYIES